MRELQAVPGDEDDAGPETGHRNALVTGPDGEDLIAADPYADLYEALPASAADDDNAAAPRSAPEIAPPPERSVRREPPPGRVPVGVRDEETAVDIDIAALGGLGLAGGAEPAVRPGTAPARRRRNQAAGPRYLTAPRPRTRPAPDSKRCRSRAAGSHRLPAVGGAAGSAGTARPADDRRRRAGGSRRMRKARELLAFLAVQQPDSASSEAISEALWPESDPGRAAGQRNLALRKAREMLRTATGLPEPRWILNVSGRYRLDQALIGTDLEAFSEALAAARTAIGEARLAACRRAVALYRGELAEGAGYEWAEPYAETARRRALDAWTTIAEILQPSDPGQALSALEAALSHDPYNEYLYVRIMRLQAAAGHPEAVRRRRNAPPVIPANMH